MLSVGCSDLTKHLSLRAVLYFIIIIFVHFGPSPPPPPVFHFHAVSEVLLISQGQDVSAEGFYSISEQLPFVAGVVFAVFRSKRLLFVPGQTLCSAPREGPPALGLF